MPSTHGQYYGAPRTRNPATCDATLMRPPGIWTLAGIAQEAW